MLLIFKFKKILINVPWKIPIMVSCLQTPHLDTVFTIKMVFEKCFIVSWFHFKSIFLSLIQWDYIWLTSWDKDRANQLTDDFITILDNRFSNYLNISKIAGEIGLLLLWVILPSNIFLFSWGRGVSEVCLALESRAWSLCMVGSDSHQES